MLKIVSEIKEFAVRGNVVDMAVGIAIGASFTAVVNSVVKDLITPLVAAVTAETTFRDVFVLLRDGKGGGPYATLAEAQADAAITLNLGAFLDALVTLGIVAVVLYFLVKATNRLHRPEQPKADPVKTRECPACYQSISLSARRCPFCTTWLANEPEDADAPDTPPAPTD
ncbi:MAG: large conductance mechanosensitive channel protein MscL [Planctomycetota bacterium]